MKTRIEYGNGVEVKISDKELRIKPVDSDEIIFDEYGNIEMSDLVRRPNMKFLSKLAGMNVKNEMATWVRVGDYIEYSPDSKSVNISEEMTGYANDAISTDTSCKWRVLSINPDDGSILIITNGFVNSVTLRGKVNFEHICKVLNLICSECYSNAALGLMARSITVEDLDNACNCKRKYIFDSEQYVFCQGLENIFHVDKNNLHDCYGGWIAETFSSEWSDEKMAMYLDRNCVKNEASFLYGTSGSGFCYKNGIYPVVHFSSDFKIVGGNGTKNKPWRVKTFRSLKYGY